MNATAVANIPVKRDIRWPRDDEHLAIYGQNGSGKTVAGMWHLSRRSFDKMPWMVLNFKRDELIEELKDIGAHSHDLTDKLPKRPGIYIIDVMPETGDELETFFKAVWEKERVGTYVDEGYCIKPNKYWHRAILTQGRAKRTPLITLSQRPVWIDPFIRSEASFHQVFFLANDADETTVNQLAPYKLFTGHDTKDLPQYWSYWCDVKGRKVNVLKPVPKGDRILGDFQSRLGGRRYFFK